MNEIDFSLFMEKSPAAAWITDRDARIIYTNPAYKKLFSVNNEIIEGKTVYDLYTKEEAEVYHRNIMQAIEKNELIEVIEAGTKGDGSFAHFLVWKFPFKSKSGYDYVGGWGIDITEIKNLQETVKDSYSRLREISFLQSHQVRRPLANILALVDILKSEEMSLQLHDLVDLLEKSAFELDEIVRETIRKSSGA